MSMRPPKPIRILFVEDSEDDAELTLSALMKAGYAPDFKRVETREEMETALRTEAWSLVLCDYSLPTFDAPEALAVLHESGVDIPFIIISATVGEEAATAVIRDGAHDFFVKGRLARLPTAIERELRDADDRRRRRDTEAALLQSRERFRLIVEHSSDFVTILEADGTIRYQSPTIERVLGQDGRAMVGTAFLDLVHPEDRSEVRRIIGEVLGLADSTQRVGFRAHHRDSSWLSVESICHNSVGDPEIRGIIITTRDMSQRDAAEKAHHAMLRAELASRTKSAFLANMSHELRTPLNAIIGFSELMEQGLAGPLSDRQKEYVSSVLQSGRHLLSLVNDILDLSKVEAGRMDLDREWTPLSSVADAVQRVVQSIAAKQGVLLVVTLDDDLPDVFIDPVRIKQVLYNVLSNGIKFTPKGGSVTLSATAKHGVIEIVVRDTGIGIRPEDLPRLFQEFEQLESSGGDKPEGTGLGLALTRRLLEMHGGTITAASEYGRGSTFTLTLPILRRPNASEMPRALMTSDSDEVQVLIVEDDADAAELIAGHLRAAGASVAVATTADDALRLARALKPRAITLDLILPGDGWAALRRLKADPATAHIPVMLISVLDEAPRGLALGASAYLVKPVTRQGLLHSLESMGVSLDGVLGVNVLLVGEDNPAMRDVWEKLHHVGCNVKRSLRVAHTMADFTPDLAIVFEGQSGPVSLPSQGASSVPVMHFEPKHTASGGPRLLLLSAAEVRRPELLVRRLRSVLDHRSITSVAS